VNQHGYAAVYAEIMGDGIPLTRQNPDSIVKALMRECSGCQALMPTRKRISRMHAAYRRKARR